MFDFDEKMMENKNLCLIERNTLRFSTRRAKVHTPSSDSLIFNMPDGTAPRDNSYRRHEMITCIPMRKNSLMYSRKLKKLKMFLI